MPTLTDKDQIPFGKHKGMKMEDVPAEYILYMYSLIKPIAPNKMTLTQKMFVNYVEDNKQVLEKQAKDKNGR